MDGKPSGYGTTRWPLPLASERWESRVHGAPERLVHAWADFIGRVPWEWFVTLTFNAARRTPVSRELASREAFWWCGLVGKVYRRPIAWVYAVERSLSGAHHAHVLIAGLPEPNWRGVTEPWKERNGQQVNVRAVTAIPRLALYTSKSVTQGGEIVLSETLERYRSQLAAEEMVQLVG